MDGVKFIEENKNFLNITKPGTVKNNKDILKHCKKCGENKPKTEFYKNKAMKDGLGFYCKECELKMKNTKRLQDEEEINKKSKNPRNKKKFKCKYCGKKVRYNHITCTECRHQLREEVYDIIHSKISDEALLSKFDIAALFPDYAPNTVYKLLDELVKEGKLHLERRNNILHYSLTNQCEDMKTVQVKDLMGDPNHNVTDNHRMKIINQLLENGLLNAKCFYVKLEKQTLTANYTEQKPLLDLYESLPEELKTSVELDISTGYPVQKITILLTK